MDSTNYEPPSIDPTKDAVTEEESSRIALSEVIEKVKKEVTPVEKIPGLRDYKNMMRQFFTVRRQRVAVCGHRFDERNQPRHANCESCWFSFFQTNGEFTKTCDEAFRDEAGNGRAAMLAIRGEKFMKRFTQFMSTIARMKAEADAMKGTCGEEHRSDGSTNQGQQVCSVEGTGSDSEREAEDNNVAN